MSDRVRARANAIGFVPALAFPLCVFLTSLHGGETHIDGRTSPGQCQRQPCGSVAQKEPRSFFRKRLSPPARRRWVTALNKTQYAHPSMQGVKLVRHNVAE